MLSLPVANQVSLCTQARDMHRSLDGLPLMVEHIIRCNPFSGHLLVFCNPAFGGLDGFVRTVPRWEIRPPVRATGQPRPRVS